MDNPGEKYKARLRITRNRVKVLVRRPDGEDQIVFDEDVRRWKQPFRLQRWVEALELARKFVGEFNEKAAAGQKALVEGHLRSPGVLANGARNEGLVDFTEQAEIRRMQGQEPADEAEGENAS